MNLMPPVTKNLLIINVLCFFAYLAFATHEIKIEPYFALHFFLDNQFRPWQIFTYMFMHGSITHLFFNMFALWMFGRIIEQTMGQGRFLFYYLTCGLGAALFQECVQLCEFTFWGDKMVEVLIETSYGERLYKMMTIHDELLYFSGTVGASGAIYGILLAFGMIYPNERLFIFPIPLPIKAKYFVVGYAVIELLSALSQKGDGVAHMAHLGGMLVGLLLLLYWRGGGGRGSHGGYSNYDRGTGSWTGLRDWFSSLFKREKPDIHVTYGGRYGKEAAYRQQKKEEEEELNRILDKVKKNGYDGLSPEEKRRLFDITRK